MCRGKRRISYKKLNKGCRSLSEDRFSSCHPCTKGGGELADVRLRLLRQRFQGDGSDLGARLPDRARGGAQPLACDASFPGAKGSACPVPVAAGGRQVSSASSLGLCIHTCVPRCVLHHILAREHILE